MAVTVVTRWKGNEDYRPRMKEAAAILKRHGAVSVRAGRCLSGEYSGQVIVAALYPDGATFGKSIDGLAADHAWQGFLAETLKVSELQDRSIIVGEEF
jgi:hypothetical protein